ncbi:MAG: YcjF family protein [Beijerinckiaceae bacterium]
MTDARKPRVFRIDGGESAATPETEALPKPARAVAILPEPDAFAPPPAGLVPDVVLPVTPTGGLSGWTKLFWSALGGLVSLAAGMSLYRLVDELMAAHPALGWVGLGLVGLAFVALLALVIREWRGLARLDAVEDIRRDAGEAMRLDDGPRAKQVVARLLAHQARDVSTASARAELERLQGEIVDGRGLLTTADRLLLAAADERAKLAIAGAAKRVSLVTAISPRAIVDILFVAAQSVMLTRRIAEIYGARPGGLGFFRLARRILGHLAITGGIAVTDSVVSQLVGHGLAARLSAKLGEGVLNGLLTARVGLACIAACRPLPYLASEEPKLQDVAGEILTDPLGRKEA